MNQSSSARRLAFAPLVALVVLSAVAFRPPGAGAAEESASPTEVASGLQKIQGIAESVAQSAGKDSAKAEQLGEGIEPVWEKIEGTLKANDKDTYVKLEDNFTLLKIGAKAGDADKTAEASESVAAAVTGYLGKYPADTTSAAEAAPSSASRSAAAATAPAADPLPRTGPRSASLLTAFAGLALGIGGLATIGGARRRVRRPTAS